MVSVTLVRAAAQHKTRTLEDFKVLAEEELGEQLPATKVKISVINRTAPRESTLQWKLRSKQTQLEKIRNGREGNGPFCSISTG